MTIPALATRVGPETRLDATEESGLSYDFFADDTRVLIADTRSGGFRIAESPGRR